MLYKRCAHEDHAKCRCAFWYCFILHGTRYRRSTRTANKQTAGRVEERRRVAILEGRDDEDAPKKVSLRAHIKDYIEHTEKKNSTAYKDEAVLRRLLDSVGDRPLDGVSPFAIEKWKSARAADRIERATVNRELNIVRGCFARAVEWGRIKVSPCETVKAYEVDDARIRVLDDEEIRAVLGADPWVSLVCRVTLECLPRLSEVLHIQRTHIGPTWIEVRRKGGRVDRIPVSNDLRARLIERASGDYVFGEGAGAPPTEQTASNRIVRELRRLGIREASHHTMRHTGVTLMLEAGVNPRVIQKLAGWTSLRMLERYGHARDAEFQRAVRATSEHLTQLEEGSCLKDSADSAGSRSATGGIK